MAAAADLWAGAEMTAGALLSPSLMIMTTQTMATAAATVSGGGLCRGGQRELALHNALQAVVDDRRTKIFQQSKQLLNRLAFHVELSNHTSLETCAGAFHPPHRLVVAPPRLEVAVGVGVVQRRRRYWRQRRQW